MDELEFYDGSYSGAQIDAAIRKVIEADSAPDATHTDALITSAGVANGISSAVKLQQTVYSNSRRISLNTGEEREIDLDSGRSWTDYNYLIFVVDGGDGGKRAGVILPRTILPYGVWWPVSYRTGSTVVNGAVRVNRVAIPNTSNPTQYYDNKLAITVTFDTPYLAMIFGGV